MKKLILMRHAKSSWKSNATCDHGRPLNKRGKRDAPLIAKRIQYANWVPELVLSSDSARTTETWQGMAPIFDPCPEVIYIHGLYHGSLTDIQKAICNVDDKVQTVLVLGHNPGWESALLWLSGEDHDLTTANAALLSSEATKWEQAIRSPASWQLHHIFRPKDHAYKDQEKSFRPTSRL